MFPVGMAGVALIGLRFSATATLVVDGTAHWALVTSFWILLGLVLLVIPLCLGFLTPYCSAISCIVQLGVLLADGGADRFHLIVSILTSVILIVMGPGAYSIDARLFGRRLLTVPPRR
jgi:uncharacterized membrane protein YphA (DoxX/SURF4 family)